MGGYPALSKLATGTHAYMHRYVDDCPQGGPTFTGKPLRSTEKHSCVVSSILRLAVTKVGCTRNLNSTSLFWKSKISRLERP